MVTALDGVKQVAIDLEHHSYRYMGGAVCVEGLHSGVTAVLLSSRTYP
jgi:hypothetical protein